MVFPLTAVYIHGNGFLARVVYFAHVKEIFWQNAILLLVVESTFRINFIFSNFVLESYHIIKLWSIS